MGNGAYELSLEYDRPDSGQGPIRLKAGRWIPFCPIK